MKTKNLPYSGLWHESPNPRFEETIVFLHHFGGNEHSASLHVRLVNDLGFHAVSFALHNAQSITPTLPLSSDLKLGLVHIWTEQTELILNSIQGKKILYSFSSPSCAALMAIARRGATDISSWICDGGPFLHFQTSLRKYLEQEIKIKNPFLRLIGAAYSKMLFGFDYEYKTLSALRKLSQDFPILSIRSWQDQLVPQESIRDFFDRQDNLNLEVLSIPEGGHLTGLRDFPEIYQPRLESFLKQTAHPLS